MFLRTMTTKSIDSYYDSLVRLGRELDTADAILIGAGAGLSTSAGFTYSGKRFEEHFSDFQEKYGFHDMYSGGFYPYDTLEEYWAFWSRNIDLNRYQPAPVNVYGRLLEPVKGVMSEILGEDCSSLAVVNRPPTRSKPLYMKVWEARKADGLEYDPEDELQQLFVAQITKYAMRNID